jgi:hypothetical protein
MYLYNENIVFLRRLLFILYTSNAHLMANGLFVLVILGCNLELIAPLFMLRLANFQMLWTECHTKALAAIL